GEDRGEHARGNHRGAGVRQPARIDAAPARSLIVTGLLGLGWIGRLFRLFRVLGGLLAVLVGDGDRRGDLDPAVYAAEGERHLAGLGSGTQVGLHRRVDDVEHLLHLAVDDQLHLPVAREPVTGDLELLFWRYLGRGVDSSGGREGGEVGLQL